MLTTDSEKNTGQISTGPSDGLQSNGPGRKSEQRGEPDWQGR